MCKVNTMWNNKEILTPPLPRHVRPLFTDVTLEFEYGPRLHFTQQSTLVGHLPAEKYQVLDTFLPVGGNISLVMWRWSSLAGKQNYVIACNGKYAVLHIRGQYTLIFSLGYFNFWRYPLLSDEFYQKWIKILTQFMYRKTRCIIC